jgi:hypothetical protein
MVPRWGKKILTKKPALEASRTIQSIVDHGAVRHPANRRFSYTSYDEPTTKSLTLKALGIWMSDRTEDAWKRTDLTILRKMWVSLPVLLLLLSILVDSSEAWLNSPISMLVRRNFSSIRYSPVIAMAINYNDPIVAEEFARVQPLPFEEVEVELKAKGIPVPPTMNEMDVRLMLVEMRLRLSGRLSTEAKRPTKFSSKFEEALWTKPAFKEYYGTLKASGDHNAQNVVAEYVNDPDVALVRYGKDYKAVIRKAQDALNAPPPVKSPTITFKGFPANMGNDALKM